MNSDFKVIFIHLFVFSSLIINQNKCNELTYDVYMHVYMHNKLVII